MKIIRLNAENIKRLVAIEIVPDPDGNLVVISGKNASGKTSTLDSIWFALGGGEALHRTPDPIREGEDTAQVTLDLGELTVTRTWRRDKPMQLKVTAKDGAKYPRPQSVLDKLIGVMSFDPLAFTQLNSREQRGMLEGMLTLPFVPAQLEAARKAAYEARTEVGREMNRLRGAAESVVVPELPFVPEEEVSIADLLDTRAQLSDQHDRFVYASVRLNDLLERRAQATEEVARLERLLAVARRDRDVTQAAVAAQERKLAELEDVDAVAVDQMIRDAEVTNRAVRARNERTELEAQAAAARERYEQLTDEIDELDDEQAAGLAAAKFPVEGLSFSPDGITYQGVPFLQCSAAEQLRVSIGMAMAMNPQIRVIRITDGSLLDSENMALIAEMAAEHDFQIWIERVDETGQVGVVIEDGTVRA